MLRIPTPSKFCPDDDGLGEEYTVSTTTHKPFLFTHGWKPTVAQPMKGRCGVGVGDTVVRVNGVMIACHKIRSVAAIRVKMRRPSS